MEFIWQTNSKNAATLPIKVRANMIVQCVEHFINFLAPPPQKKNVMLRYVPFLRISPFVFLSVSKYVC